MSSTFERLRQIAAALSGVNPEKLSPTTAVYQDIGLVGDDVTDFAAALTNEFGDWIWSWPWERFAQLDERLSLLFPVMLFWQLISWPFRGSFEYPDAYERLELGHIAAVIDNGEWFEP